MKKYREQVAAIMKNTRHKCGLSIDDNAHKEKNSRNEPILQNKSPLNTEPTQKLQTPLSGTYKQEMSWNAYTDAVIQYYPAMKGCALAGHDGSVWATSGTACSAAECAAIVSGFGSRDAIAYAGVRHMCLTATADQKMAKKGTSAMAVMKTGQTYVIVMGEDAPQKVLAAASYLASDLIGRNY